ncbi:MAG: N-acetyl-gamma-glutamyl-phosphate reductase [Gammaproteobacteria bacterium]|nr:MAG: N-acetyl-gamma-glutamyl-phosphate reductase [Gammaproteobacteria bacterium]
MIKTGIIGGTGYTGVELLRILAKHPDVTLSVITSRSEAGRPVADLFENLRGHVDLAFSEPDIGALKACDVVFSATPNGIAMTMADELLDAGVRLIDLAADFRIRDLAVWEKWYGMKHACPKRVAQAVYGLPEVNRADIAKASLIANPGCYPTAVTLGFMPLLKAGLIDPARLIADVKSGVSGAGRGAKVSTLFSEMGESFAAYAVPGHRHQPETAQTLASMTSGEVGLTFIPHLLPMIRGIHATLYADLTGEADLQSLYEAAYAEEPFVDVLPAGSHPSTRSVKSANTCRIAVHQLDQRRVVILSVIDNLVKGAAGQAVQNMNIMFGLEETQALDMLALIP